MGVQRSVVLLFGCFAAAYTDDETAACCFAFCNDFTLFYKDSNNADRESGLNDTSQHNSWIDLFSNFETLGEVENVHTLHNNETAS